MTTAGTRDAAATRARLLDATLAELDGKGFTALRIDDVARRAGLTTGAIYGIFATKHDMVVAALLQRNADAVRSAVAHPPATTGDRDVLAAALAVLDAKGYRAVRLRDVAGQAGVSSAELAAAYPTKHHLLAAAMAAREPEAFEAALARAGAPAIGVDESLPTTDRLHAAALEVLDERGYRGATVGEIARRAGVTTGAIYANYGSKGGLLDAVLARRYEALFRSALDEVEAAKASGGVLGALGAVLARDAAVEHRALMEVLAAASRNEPVRAAVEEQLARRHDVVTALLDEAKEAGVLAADAPTGGLAHVIQLVALGNVVGQAVGLPTPDGDELQRALRQLGGALGPGRGGRA